MFVVLRSAAWHPSVHAALSSVLRHSSCAATLSRTDCCQYVSTLTVVVTSNQDACWPIGLVEEAAVDGQEGTAHDAPGGGGDPCHLWAITNIVRFRTSKSKYCFLTTDNLLLSTNLRMSGTSTVYPTMKLWTDSCLANSCFFFSGNIVFKFASYILKYTHTHTHKNIKVPLPSKVSIKYVAQVLMPCSRDEGFYYDLRFKKHYWMCVAALTNIRPRHFAGHVSPVGSIRVQPQFVSFKRGRREMQHSAKYRNTYIVCIYIIFHIYTYSSSESGCSISQGIPPMKDL